MGVIIYDTETTTPIPPATLFKALVLDADTLIPKIMPQAIKSVEILEGDGGHGTIKLTTFGEWSTYKTAKQRVDGVDKDNFTYNYSIIEGDALAGGIESISSSADGGSSCKNSSTYHVKGDARITEEDIRKGKEKAKGMFKTKEDIRNSCVIDNIFLLLRFNVYATVFKYINITIYIDEIKTCGS